MLGEEEGDNDCRKSRVQKCYLCFENHIGLKETFYSQEDVCKDNLESYRNGQIYR